MTSRQRPDVQHNSVRSRQVRGEGIDPERMFAKKQPCAEHGREDRCYMKRKPNE